MAVMAYDQYADSLSDGDSYTWNTASAHAPVYSDSDEEKAVPSLACFGRGRREKPLLSDIRLPTACHGNKSEAVIPGSAGLRTGIKDKSLRIGRGRGRFDAQYATSQQERQAVAEAQESKKNMAIRNRIPWHEIRAEKIPSMCEQDEDIVQPRTIQIKYSDVNRINGACSSGTDTSGITSTCDRAPDVKRDAKDFPPLPSHARGSTKLPTLKTRHDPAKPPATTPCMDPDPPSKLSLGNISCSVTAKSNVEEQTSSCSLSYRDAAVKPPSRNKPYKQRPAENLPDGLEGLNVIVLDNLEPETSLETVKEFLESFGKVVDCTIMEKGNSVTINARMNTADECAWILNCLENSEDLCPGAEGRKVRCYLKQ